MAQSAPALRTPPCANALPLQIRGNRRKLLKRSFQVFDDFLRDHVWIGDDRGAAVLPQDGEDVLEEVELFVTRAAFPIFSPISVVEVEIADFQVPNPPC